MQIDRHRRAFVLALLSASSLVGCGASGTRDDGAALDPRAPSDAGAQRTFDAEPPHEAASNDGGGGLIFDAGDDARCGKPNDAQGCACKLGTKQRCYVGDPAKAGVGSCAWGAQTCEGSGEFGTFGACVGSVAPTAAACDGVDHTCTGKVNEGCGCTVGATQSCYSGPAGTEGVGVCRGGAQTCQSDGTWGACTGEVVPTAETCAADGVDHDCNGQSGCSDPSCATNPVCRAAFCSSGGSVYVNNVWYCSAGSSPPGVIEISSGLASSVPNVGCGGPMGTGGTFSAKCAGTYTVCGRVISNAGGCLIADPCVTVSVPSDGATVSLPAFPGWGPVSGACVASTYPSAGGQTCIDVSGTTTDGTTVSKPSVTCIAPFFWGGGGGGGGSGGGSF